MVWKSTATEQTWKIGRASSARQNRSSASSRVFSGHVGLPVMKKPDSRKFSKRKRKNTLFIELAVLLSLSHDYVCRTREHPVLVRC
jgi:hypothetical protein